MEKNEAAAKDWYRNAAKWGHAEVVKWFCKAAKKGMPKRNGREDGHGRVSSCAMDKLSLLLIWLFFITKEAWGKESIGGVVFARKN